MVYLNHRSFLPCTDPLRQNHAKFPSKKKIPKLPCAKDQSYVDKSNKLYDAAKTSRERKTISQRTGCKGSYALRNLPNHDRHLNTPVEPMHLIKNIAEHLVRLLSGLDDTIKVRTEEERRGRFREAWAKEGKSILPPAPFVLSAADIAITTERANCIQVPMTVEWKPRPIFVKNRGNMTSHQWKELVSTHILKYTLRGLLGKQQRETIFFFLNVLADLCAEVIDVATLDTLEYNVHKALSLIECDFPVSLNVSVFHLLHHLPTYLRRFGPVYSFWMYPFE